MCHPAAYLFILLIGFFLSFPLVKKTFAVYYADCAAGEVAIGSCSDALKPPNDFVDPITEQNDTGQNACIYWAGRYDSSGSLQATCQNWCAYSPAVIPYDIPYDTPESDLYCPKSAAWPNGYPQIPHGICPRNSSTVNPADGSCTGLDPFSNSNPQPFENAVYCCKYTEACVETGPNWGACTAKSSNSCGLTGGTRTGTYDCPNPVTGAPKPPIVQDCDIGTANCDDCQSCQSGTCRNNNVITGCQTDSDCLDSNACTLDVCNRSTDVCGNIVGKCNRSSAPDGTKWDVANNKVCCNGVKTNNSTCSPCLVTTSPSVYNLNVGGTGVITATVTGLPAGRTITQMRFGAYPEKNTNRTIATAVSPDLSSPYSTIATAIATGNTAVWATADLNDGSTCETTGATDTDINVNTLPAATCGGTCILNPTTGESRTCGSWQTCGYDTGGIGTCMDNLACIPEYVPPSVPVYVITVNHPSLVTFLFELTRVSPLQRI